MGCERAIAPDSVNCVRSREPVADCQQNLQALFGVKPETHSGTSVATELPRRIAAALQLRLTEVPTYALHLRSKTACTPSRILPWPSPRKCSRGREQRRVDVCSKDEHSSWRKTSPRPTSSGPSALSIRLKLQTMLSRMPMRQYRSRSRGAGERTHSRRTRTRQRDDAFPVLV